LRAPIRRAASRARSAAIAATHLVPVPQVVDLAERNAMLLAGCERDVRRRIDGRAESVGEAWALAAAAARAAPAAV
jgi:hypothetical protein